MTELIGKATAKNTQSMRLVSSKTGAPGTALKKSIPKDEVTNIAGRNAIVIHAIPRMVRLSRMLFFVVAVLKLYRCSALSRCRASK
jgi:hypothetical protein